jgi:hypothetical protein
MRVDAIKRVVSFGELLLWVVMLRGQVRLDWRALATIRDRRE